MIENCLFQNISFFLVGGGPDGYDFWTGTDIDWSFDGMYSTVNYSLIPLFKI